MVKQEKSEYDILFDRMLDDAVNYTEHLIKDGISENTLKMSNGFDVIFRDRKRNRK